jgi:hypothetical protein
MIYISRPAHVLLGGPTDDLHSLLASVHPPEKVVVLGDEILGEISSQLLAPLEVVPKEGNCEVGHAGYHLLIVHHHVVLADK